MNTLSKLTALLVLSAFASSVSAMDGGWPPRPDQRSEQKEDGEQNRNKKLQKKKLDEQKDRGPRHKGRDRGNSNKEIVYE